MTIREGRTPSRNISRRTSVQLLFGLLGSGCSVFLKRGWDSRREGARSFSDEEMALLRRTTTVFLLRTADMARRDEFEEALERVWRLTEIEVVSYERLAEYADTSKYSYLVIEGETFAGYQVSFYYLTLFLLPPGDDEEGDDIGYFRIDLQATLPTLQLTLESGATNDAINEVYRQGDFHNWSPGFLATYLQSVQTDLEQGLRRKELDEIEDTERLERLREATLIIPDHLLFEYGVDTDGSKRLDPKELLSEYPYRYQIVSRDALDALIARADEQRQALYIFDYVLSASAKLVSIYEYGRGAIYREVSPMRTALTAQDFDIF